MKERNLEVIAQSLIKMRSDDKAHIEALKALCVWVRGVIDRLVEASEDEHITRNLVALSEALDVEKSPKFQVFRDNER